MTSRKMKDSGVEWIGEIPEEWSVCRLKSHPQVVSIIAGQSPAGEDIKSEPTGPDYVEFHQGNSLFTSSGQIDRSERYALPGKLAMPQDILVSMRAPVGEIAKSNRPIVMGRGLAAIRGKDNWHKFGYYWMLAIGQELRAQSSGTTFDGISTRFLSNIPVLLSPLSEQQAIADYLDYKVNDIDTDIRMLNAALGFLSTLSKEHLDTKFQIVAPTLDAFGVLPIFTQGSSNFEEKLDLIRKKVTLLEELRSSVIFDAVTGKIDIPPEFYL